LKRYELLVRIGSCMSARTFLYASNDYEAKRLGELQYGQGNVLNYTALPD